MKGTSGESKAGPYNRPFIFDRDREETVDRIVKVNTKSNVERLSHNKRRGGYAGSDFHFGK